MSCGWRVTFGSWFGYAGGVVGLVVFVWRDFFCCFLCFLFRFIACWLAGFGVCRLVYFVGVYVDG